MGNINDKYQLRSNENLGSYTYKVTFNFPISLFYKISSCDMYMDDSTFSLKYEDKY